MLYTLCEFTNTRIARAITQARIVRMPTGNRITKPEGFLFTLTSDQPFTSEVVLPARLTACFNIDPAAR